MADKELFGISEQLDCSDCVNHGGDWNCDHVHCRKGTDTISRQAAIDAIMGEPTDAHYPSWYAEQLEQLPSAQRTGRWIWNKNGMDWGLGAWCCSECRTKAETWWATDEKYNPLMCSGGKFCGNCGARMDGDNG